MGGVEWEEVTWEELVWECVLKDLTLYPCVRVWFDPFRPSMAT